MYVFSHKSAGKKQLAVQFIQFNKVLDGADVRNVKFWKRNRKEPSHNSLVPLRCITELRPSDC